MKERAVSALRIERGLRTEARNAEPQVVGLAPQTTVMTERANTMKAHILRDPKAIEPQNPTRRDPARWFDFICSNGPESIADRV